MESREHAADRLLLVACTISFVSYLGSYMRLPIVPLFAASLGADAVQVGMINGAFMLMAGALSIPSGLISDRLGRRPPLLGGLLILAGSSLLLYWSRTPLQVALIYLVFGMGLSTLSPSLMASVADVTPPAALGRAYGWYTMAMYTGMALGPAAGGFLGTALGLRMVFPVAGGLIFVMFFVALAFLPSHSGHSRGDGTSPAILPALKVLLENRPFTACLVATLGSSMGYGMFVTFMPLAMKGQGMATTHVGFVFAIQTLTNALSRYPSGWLCDRVADRGRLVAGGLALFFLALASFGPCTSVVSLMAVAALMGGSMGIAYTVICTLIADVVPREVRGLAMGCYNTCVYFGMMLSSAGMGPIIRAEGFRAGFFIIGATGVVVLSLFKVLYRRHAVVC